LRQTLGECLWLYNKLLEDRKRQFEENQPSLTLYDQHSQTTQYKKERQSLKQVHSQVLQNVAVRIDLAFKAFFRRVKEKNGAAGFPRFKAFFRYDSFTYPQSGFSLDGHHLKLSKIGNLHIKVHRPLEGDIKTLTVKRSATDKWYASFSCEVEAKPLPESVEAIALDVGLESFLICPMMSALKIRAFFAKKKSDWQKPSAILPSKRRVHLKEPDGAKWYLGSMKELNSSAQILFIKNLERLSIGLVLYLLKI
jgi:putative transposase